MKEKNSIWKKILNYIKNIFSSNQKLLNEGIEEEFIEKIDFKSKLLEQNRMIILQRKYELGEIREEDLSFEDREKLFEFYEKQVEMLERNINIKKQELLNYKNKIITVKNKSSVQDS